VSIILAGLNRGRRPAGSDDPRSLLTQGGLLVLGQREETMNILAKIIIVIICVWLLIDLIGAIWFIVLHHRGELVADVPDDVKDIF
jgi:hypothetical protein